MSLLVGAIDRGALSTYLAWSQARTVPFKHGLRRNDEPHALQKTVITSTSTTAAAGEIAKFQLARYGVLKRLTLRVTFTLSGDTGTTGHYGILGGLPRFRLMASGDRTVAMAYPESIADWILQQEPDARHIWLDKGHLHTQASDEQLAAGEHVFELPVIFSFLEGDLDRALNLRIAEPLELWVDVGAVSSWLTTASGTLSKLDFDLFADYVELGKEAFEKWIANARTRQPRLQYSVYEEMATTMTAGEVATRVTLTCQAPVFRMIVAIKAGSTLRMDTRPLQTTTRIQFCHGDITVIDKSAGQLQVDAVTKPFRYLANSEVFILQFALEPGGREQTGYVSMAQMVDPHLIVHQTGGASAGQVVRVFHLYHYLEATDPDTGIVQQRVLS